MGVIFFLNTHTKEGKILAKETYVNVRKNKFTMVSNGVLWNKDLTLQAKGLLSIFLSNSGDWELHMREIITRSKNGRDAHYNIINELISTGYFARVEVRDGNRFVEMIYIFSDDPGDVEEKLKEYRGNPNHFVNLDKRKKPEEPLFPENPETEKSTKSLFPDFQETESQYTESQDYNNTKGNNTISNNTNLSESEGVSLSIDDVLNELQGYIPVNILKQLSINKKRLTDDKIEIMEIIAFYQSTENTIHDNDFAMILSNVLKKTKGTIHNFHSVMRTAISNWRKEYEGVSPAVTFENIDGELPEDFFKLPDGWEGNR